MLKRYGIVVVGILILAVIAAVTWTLSQRKTSHYSPVPSGVGIIKDQEDILSAEEPKAVEPEEESQAPALPFDESPTKPAASEAQWKAIGGDEVWSVAWSPDGKRVAFLSVDEHGDDIAVEGHDISRGIVWVLENPGATNASLTKLIRRTIRQRIPVGLFWLSDQELGWAATADYPEGFKLYAARLSDGAVRLISNRRIGLHFIEDAGSEGWDGPGDLYFDPVSRCLFLSGEDNTEGQPVWIARYNPADDSLEKRKTWLAGYAGICAFTGADGKTSVYLCSWEDNLPEPKAWVWPNVSKAAEGVPQGTFIRVSPSGRTVSWLGGRDRGYALVFYDVSTKKAKEVALWQNLSWMGPRGCPYSWSPDGKQIAYSDGRRIRLIQVSSNPSGRTDH